MNQQQSAINLRRKIFHKQIRSRQLTEYFSKRRHELIQSSTTNTNDENKIKQILKNITNFCIQKLKQIIIKIAKLGPSQSIFYQLTGFNPETPPTIFKAIMQEQLIEHEETLIWEDLGISKQYSVDQRNELFEIYKELEEELERRSLHFIEITNLIKTIQEMNLLCKEKIIIFLSFFLNMHHLLKKLKVILSIEQQQFKLIGNQSALNYQAETCLKLLQNILTADDSLLQPLLPEFIELNCCNPASLGLFFNLFLIKCENKAVRCKLFNYFIRLLEKNREFFLEEYRAIVATIHAATQASGDLRVKGDLYNFQILEERISKLLGQLLKVLNMRFESASLKDRAEDYHSIYNLMMIFHVFAEQTQLIRLIMEERAICMFLLNRLVYSQEEREAYLLRTCLSILSYAVRDHYSLHYFINEQPRFLIKIMSLLERYLQPGFIRVQQYEQLSNLQYMLYVLSDLSSNNRGQQILISRQIHCKLMHIYTSIPGQTTIQKQIKLNCEMIYLNILLALRAHPNSPQLFFHQLFSSAPNQPGNGCYLMLMSLLKYSSNKRKSAIVNSALAIITYICDSCFECREYEFAKKMLFSETITAQLEQLLNCSQQRIVNMASRAIEGIRDLRRVKIYRSNTIQQEQYV